MTLFRFLAAAVLLTLAACDTPALEGQVAARIDDIEITDREVLAEATASGADLSQPSARAAVLDRVIDRKLLARAGETTLADRTPAAQIDARRAREDVLARAYARRVIGGLTPPSADEIDRFMRANPHRFAARATYLFDRLTGAPGASPTMAGLSTDAAARSLDRAAHRYHRQLVLTDSETLIEREASRIAALAPGQTLRSETAAGFTLDTFILKQPVTELPEAQRARARDLLIQSRSAAAMKAAIASLRADAKIAVRAESPR